MTDKLERIPGSSLSKVTGGGWMGSAARGAESLTKWWKGAEKVTPKEIYTEGRDLLRDGVIAGGAAYGAGKLLTGKDSPQPAPVDNNSE